MRGGKLRLYLVEHLYCGLDGGLCLVGIEGAGAEYSAVFHAPCYLRLHESVGAAAGRDGDGIVLKHRECASQRLLIYIT